MNSSSRSRWQISIRTFLIVATIVILSVSHWNTSRKLRSANMELRQLRNEVGRLSISDPSQVHIIALDSPERDSWRWRLYLPKGARYKWQAACEQIPNGKPASSGIWGSVSNQPYWKQANEVLVSARLVEQEDGDYTLAVQTKIGDTKNQMGGMKMRIPKENMQWRKESPGRHVHMLGKYETEAVDPAGPIILLSHRAMKEMPDGTRDIADEPMPGFMIWLERR